MIRISKVLWLLCLLLAVVSCKKEGVSITPIDTPDFAYYSISSTIYEYTDVFPMPEGRMRNIRLEYSYNFQSGFAGILRGEIQGDFAAYIGEYITGADLAEFQYTERTPGVWVLGNYTFTLQDSVLVFSHRGEEYLMDFPFAFGTFKPGEPYGVSLTINNNGFRADDYRARLAIAGFVPDEASDAAFIKNTNGKKYTITINGTSAVCLIQ